MGYHSGMRLETELIPYITRHLHKSPLVVFAPHPDDEVFGCGGVLIDAVQAGCEIHTIIFTDGSAQGQGADRRKESREAARRMSCPEPRFLDFVDRSLEPDSDELRQTVRELLLELKPRTLLVPSTAEIHPDHRALGICVYTLLRNASPESAMANVRADLDLVSYEVSAFLRPNLLVDITDYWKTLVHAAESFGSQNEVLPYLEIFSAVAAVRRLTVSGTVLRAAAYHVVNGEYIRNNPELEWAAAQGAVDGLEIDESISSLRHEILQLEALLDEIYRSKTWRLHSMFESLKNKLSYRPAKD
jgi:LmbE family N-acetylglucosaminyl deacetylase